MTIKKTIIQLKKLAIKTTLGCDKHEQLKKRLIFLDISFSLKRKITELADNLENTVDYKKLAQKITDEISKNSFYLIETIAEKALQIILAEDLIKKATVTVTKPKPFKQIDAASVTVTGKSKKK